MKINKKSLIFSIVLSGALTGCGSMNSALADRSESVEMYHIFDIQTNASPDKTIKAASEGLRRNINSIQENRPLQLNKQVPSTPEKFNIVNMATALQGSPLGGLIPMANAGAGLKTATCDGAVWTGRAVRNISGYNNLNLTVCLYRYKKGYQLDMFAVFHKNSGGIMGGLAAATDTLVGTPEEWVNKTFVDTVRSIESGTGGKVTHVEGQPEIGNLPWIDAAIQ